MTKKLKKPKTDNINQLQLELGCVATGKFYEFQEIRKGTMSRIRNIIFRKVTGLDLREIQKKKKQTKEEKEYLSEYVDKNLYKHIQKLKSENKLSEEDAKYIDTLFELVDDVKEKEAKFKKIVESIVENQPIYTEFAEHIKGLGALMCSMLLYYFGYCEKAKYASSLWAFAGLYPGAKFENGQTGHFNPKCRMFMYRVGQSFIYQRSPRYRPIYDAEKARQMKLLENEHELAPKSLGHADARARRKMVKHFLCDYYVWAKTFTGQEVSEIYPIAKMGHKHFDNIMDWLETQKKVALQKQEKL